ncbi:MAG TPA: cytochrome c3 family protein [Desulfuromonadaceae bacterium]
MLFVVMVPFLSLAADRPEIVCIQCHGTLPGKLGEPVKLWRGSIHAENGIACNDCHGGDPKDAANAMSPARGFLGAPKETAIPDFCGRCHVGVKADYLASAHGRALGKGGPTCVTCHSNHLVLKASLDLINEQSCSRCHSFERARVIKAAMQETDTMIAGIDSRITSYKAQGADTDRLEKGLFAVRNRFHTLFHNVDVAMVRQESAQIQAELQKIRDVLQGLDDSRRKRRIAGGIAVAAALLTAWLLHLYRKTYD